MARSIEEINESLAAAATGAKDAWSNATVLDRLVQMIMLLSEKLDRICEGEGIE